jgi:hypothetical protein
MRHDDSPDLFGGGCGAGTSGDIECDICQEKYNQGADDAEDYHHRPTVGWTSFAGMTVCDCCFESIEDEILRRMPQILPWYQKIVDKRLSRAMEDSKNLQILEMTQRMLKDIDGKQKT